MPLVLVIGGGEALVDLTYREKSRNGRDCASTDCLDFLLYFTHSVTEPLVPGVSAITSSKLSSIEPAQRHQLLLPLFTETQDVHTWYIQ